MQSNSKEGWTTVSYKKNRSNKKSLQINNFDNIPNEDKPVLQHQNWNEVTIKGTNPTKNYQNIQNKEQVITIKKQNAGTNKQNNINQNLKKLENDSDDEDNLKPKIKTVNLNLQIKIQQQRTQLNMTQKELAKKCNLLLSDIQDLENGKTLLDQNKINKVSKVLGISLSNKKK